jgi:pSer/pThr/pTyr-binding forkhead associated (FHA) protein
LGGGRSHREIGMLHCVMLIEEPENAPRSVTVQAGMVFGRAPKNDCVVRDTTVGSRQFRIVELEPGEYLIEDLGSTNSTRIHGGRTLNKGERHPLKEGLKLYAGKSKFTVTELSFTPDSVDDRTVSIGTPTEHYDPYEESEPEPTVMGGGVPGLGKPQFVSPAESPEVKTQRGGLPSLPAIESMPTDSVRARGLPGGAHSPIDEDQRTSRSAPGLPGAVLRGPSSPSAEDPKTLRGAPGVPGGVLQHSTPSVDEDPKTLRGGPGVPAAPAASARDEPTMIGSPLPGRAAGLPSVSSVPSVPTDRARRPEIPAIPSVPTFPTEPSPSRGAPAVGRDSDIFEPEPTMIGRGLPSFGGAGVTDRARGTGLPSVDDGAGSTERGRATGMPAAGPPAGGKQRGGGRASTSAPDAGARSPMLDDDAPTDSAKRPGVPVDATMKLDSAYDPAAEVLRSSEKSAPAHWESDFERLRPRLVISGGGIHRVARISHPTFFIGRQEGCQLVLQHPYISDVHVRIGYDGQFFLIEDCGSKNGTYIDGARLAPGETPTLYSETRVTLGAIDALFIFDEDGISTSTHEDAGRRLAAQRRVTKSELKEAQRSAAAEKRHVGELLIESKAIQITDWVDAYREARGGGTPKKGGSSSRLAPKSGRVKLPPQLPYWIAIGVLVLVVVFLLVKVLGSGDGS